MKTLITMLSLIALIAPAVFGQETQSDYQQLETEFDQEWSAWRARRIAAERSGATPQALAEILAEDPTSRYFARFEQGAARHEGKPLAAPYLKWVSRSGARGDQHAAASRALDQL